jgi:chaperonin GroEL
VNAGITTLREAALSTAKQAGDGTTASIVLAQAIYEAGLGYVEEGANVGVLQRELQSLTEGLVKFIQKRAIKIKQSSKKQLAKVATISANNDPIIGKKIAEIVSKVGKDGLITVEESDTIGVSTDYVEGMQVDSGLLTPHLITNFEKLRAEMENPYVLVTDYNLSSIQTLEPIINAVFQKGENRSIVIFAPSFDGDVPVNLLSNHAKGVMNFILVEVTGYDQYREDVLQDIAIQTGATFVSSKTGLRFNDTLGIEIYGRASKVISDREKTIVVGGGGLPEDIKNRISQAKKLSEIAEEELEKVTAELRYARMSGGVAVVKVGAPTDVERRELVDRVDDAARATQAALDGGIVPGAGKAYAEYIDSYLFRIRTGKATPAELILADVQHRISEQILENAGLYDEYSKIVFKNGRGVNVITGKVCDLMDEGIVDPAKVVCQAITNAVSVATQLLLTSVVVVEEKEEKQNDKV